MARTKPAPDSKLLSRRVMVNVKRDQTTSTPRVVWAHEIPILEGIFGEGNIVAVEPEALDEGYSPKPSVDMLVHNKKQDAIRRPSESLGLGFVFIGNARAEYDRLALCYGMHPDVRMSWVENVYGRFVEGRFAQLLGEPELEDLPEDQLRELTLAYGYSLTAATFKSTEEERQQAAAAAKEFSALKKPDLVKLATEQGVEIG